LIALEQGQEEVALGHFDRVLALDPKSAPAHLERAKIDLRQRRAAEALAHLDRVVELLPSDPTPHYLRGMALARLGRKDEATAEQRLVDRLKGEEKRLTEIRLKLLEAPNDPDLQCEVARWMFANQRAAEGQQWLEKVLREHPRHLAAARLLADELDRLGQYGLANHYRLQASLGTKESPRSP
jgi:tetratricopeptide (TPR) repeat protein